MRNPLRDRALRVVGHASTPLSTGALRTALGIRNQTLLTLLHELVIEGLVQHPPPRGLDRHASASSRS